MDDITLLAENEEEQKSLLMSVKEENEKADLKFNIKNTKIMASGPITLWQIEGEKVEAVRDFGEGNGTPLQYSCLENPWAAEPGRLQSKGSLRVGHD